MNTMIPLEQKMSLIDDLEELGVPFRAFWDMSDIYYTDQIQTAAVSCQNDRIAMLLNPAFLDSLSERGRLFVLCHEQMHVMFNHFQRMQFNKGDGELKNIAADLSINHSLVKNYSFEREDLGDWRKFCWVETVFPDKEVSDNETCEFYYSLLKSEVECGGMNSSVLNSLDDHSMGDGISKEVSEKLEKMIQDYIEEQTEGMSEDEKEEWLDNFTEEMSKGGYSSEGFGNTNQVLDPPVSPDNNWKSIYKQIPKRLLAAKTRSHWLTRQRSHSVLPDQLMLPSDFEQSEEDIVRCRVYLDTSGSCLAHARHFLESALSLPKKMFDIEFFGFTTKVYDISKRPPYKLNGFGSTNFNCIQDHAESCGKKLDAVMVFTDGFAPKITPANPKSWHWFIVPDRYSTTEYIDPRCNIYNLADLHWKGKSGYK